ncbi:phage tail tube protein [Sphingobium sp. Z007]|uniref:phage tail tube protein n=1 Tax=Sphingobium sp. Z007 TaxID=627495 RepID=UPI000B49E9A5|nr:phage tail tube protein [Sphingobium sp. Z007]
MGFGQGIYSVMHLVGESAYGVTPASGFRKLPFVSHSMGEERPLIEDDQLGLGREGADPSYDVATNTGDIVVPVDVSAFGVWLTAIFGAPVTSGPGPFTHAFQSGGSVLPAHSIEIGSPDVPSYSVHYGAVANQMRIAMARSGMLNATISMIAQGESAQTSTSVAGTPLVVKGPRFAQATGTIKRDNVALGNVVSADLSISNGLSPLEVIRSDGRIGGVLSGAVQAMLRFTAHFDSLDLLNAATDGTPVNLSEIGWSRTGASLKFALPRVFLPRQKRPISGPGGIMMEFNCQAAAPDGGHKISATLINNINSY